MVAQAKEATSDQQWENAAALWERVLERAEDRDGRFSMQLARVYRKLGWHDRAEELLQRVLAADPDHDKAAISLAKVAMHRGDWHAAIDRWNNVLARFPHHEITARRKLVKAHRKLGNDEQIRQHREHLAGQHQHIDLADVLARCLGLNSRPPADQIATSYFADGCESEYVRVHTIENTGAGHSAAVVEKAMRTSNDFRRGKAERHLALPQHVDLGAIRTPRLLHVIKQEDCLRLFFEHISGSSPPRDLYLQFYDHGAGLDVIRSIIDLIASIGRAPVSERDIENMGCVPSYSAFRTAHAAFAEPIDDALLRQSRRLLAKGLHRQAERIIKEYRERESDIQNSYRQLPRLLYHGDVQPQNLIISDQDGLPYVLDWGSWGLEPAGADLSKMTYLVAGNVLDGTVMDIHRERFNTIVRLYRDSLDHSPTEEDILLACHVSATTHSTPWAVKGSRPELLKTVLSSMKELTDLMR